MKPLERFAAQTYAGWFRCLADPTRIMILNLLALHAGEMSVGAIVEAMDIQQSTVSHHLKLLEQTGFVCSNRRGTSTYFSVNERCVERFPTAAQLVMGRVPVPPKAVDHPPVWLHGSSLEPKSANDVERKGARVRV